MFEFNEEDVFKNDELSPAKRNALDDEKFVERMDTSFIDDASEDEFELTVEVRSDTNITNDAEVFVNVVCISNIAASTDAVLSENDEDKIEIADARDADWLVNTICWFVIVDDSDDDVLTTLDDNMSTLKARDWLVVEAALSIDTIEEAKDDDVS